MPDSSVIARWIFIAGIGLFLLAGIIWMLGRLNINFGELPGDFRIQRGNTSCFVPIVSSLLLSIILTVLINLILWFLRK